MAKVTAEGIILDKLPKSFLENDPLPRIGRRMLNSARKDTLNFGENFYRLKVINI
jgi:hypothetical protein